MKKNNTLTTITILLLCVLTFAWMDVGYAAKETKADNAIDFLNGESTQTMITTVRSPFRMAEGLRVIFERIEQERLAKKREEERLRREEEARRAQELAMKAQQSFQKVEPVKIPDLPMLNLIGVIYRTDKPMAIINQEVYTQGEIINFAEDIGSVAISAIRNDGLVEVTHYGNTYVLSLEERPYLKNIANGDETL